MHSCLARRCIEPEKKPRLAQTGAQASEGSTSHAYVIGDSTQEVAPSRTMSWTTSDSLRKNLRRRRARQQLELVDDQHPEISRAKLSTAEVSVKSIRSFSPVLR